MIRFEIPGDPVAKARPRVVRVGPFTRAFTPDRTVRFEDSVRLHAQAAGAKCLSGAVALEVEAVWPMKGQPRKRVPRPSSPKTTRPDLDNVAKAVLDALNGVAYFDDGQVCELHVTKRHAAQGEPARTIVTVRALHPATREENEATE